MLNSDMLYGYVLSQASRRVLVEEKNQLFFADQRGLYAYVNEKLEDIKNIKFASGKFWNEVKKFYDESRWLEGRIESCTVSGKILKISLAGKLFDLTTVCGVENRFSSFFKAADNNLGSKCFVFLVPQGEKFQPLFDYVNDGAMYIPIEKTVSMSEMKDILEKEQVVFDMKFKMKDVPGGVYDLKQFKDDLLKEVALL